MERSLFNSLLLPDLKVMLEENDGPALQEFCNALYPGVAAEVIEGLEPAQAWQVLSHCQPGKQAYIFQFLPLTYQVALVESIDRKPLSRLIEEMSPDDRVDLLERMDPEEVENLLPLVAQAERADIRKLLSYPEDSAGSIMTTEYASLPADITVQEALNRLRLQAPSRETIYYVYITDADRHLIGFLSLRHLIEAKPRSLLSDVMERDIISVRVDDDQEQVAREVAKYDFIAIPVVDHQNKLVGIITHDDVADVLLEEATEDQQRLAAVEPLEDAYLREADSDAGLEAGVLADDSAGGIVCDGGGHRAVHPRRRKRGQLDDHVFAARAGERRQHRFAVGDADHSDARAGRIVARRLEADRIAGSHAGPHVGFVSGSGRVLRRLRDGAAVSCGRGGDDGRLRGAGRLDGGGDAAGLVSVDRRRSGVDVESADCGLVGRHRRHHLLLDRAGHLVLRDTG